MRSRCPCCGATSSLDVLVAHEDARAALAAVFQLSQPLGSAMVRYLALFRPAKRELTMARVATLTHDLLPSLQVGFIPRKGRDWPVTPGDWVQAIELTLAARDAGKLTLPLTGHGYLFEVLCSLADKAERVQEEALHAERLSRGQTPATVTVREVTAGRDPERSPKKGMPAGFKANLAALRAGTLQPKESK